VNTRSRALFFIALLVLMPTAVFGMTSTNYFILWDSLNLGGTDDGTSTNYMLRDTIGEHGTGFSQSENYVIGAGYRIGEGGPPSLSLVIGTQEDAILTQWSAFSSANHTVTVSDASSFSADDYVGVIEDEGFAQLVAVGKITDVSGSVITVDAWEGEPSALSATSSGANDYVYRMNGQDAELGVMTPSTQATSMTVTEVDTNAVNGYTVSIQATDNLTNGTSTILSVSDGSVSVNSEEYGAEAVGTKGADADQDLPIPVATTRTVQESSYYASTERVAVIYKLSIIASTPSGNFTQIVLYWVTGNF
jgi:hypothetical protein